MCKQKKKLLIHWTSVGDSQDTHDVEARSATGRDVYDVAARKAIDQAVYDVGVRSALSWAAYDSVVCPTDYARAEAAQTKRTTISWVLLF